MHALQAHNHRAHSLGSTPQLHTQHTFLHATQYFSFFFYEIFFIVSDFLKYPHQTHRTLPCMQRIVTHLTPHTGSPSSRRTQAYTCNPSSQTPPSHQLRYHLLPAGFWGLSFFAASAVFFCFTSSSTLVASQPSGRKFLQSFSASCTCASAAVSAPAYMARPFNPAVQRTAVLPSVLCQRRKTDSAGKRDG